MEHSTHSIVEMFFKYLTERDLERLVDLFSENIDWYIPGDESKAPWLGKRESKNGVSESYKLLWENTNPISVTVEDILIDKDVVIISGQFCTQMLRTDKTVHSIFFIKLIVTDGLITKYRLLEDSYAVAKSLTNN